MERIALFLPSLHVGGAERATLNLARGFLELGRAVDLVVGTAEGALRTQVPPAVRLVDLRVPRAVRGVAGLARYLRAERPALLVAAIMNGNLAAIAARAAARAPVRLAVTLHASHRNVMRHERAPKTQLLGWLERRTYRYADHLIAVSRGVADDFVAAAPWASGRVTVIANPVVTDELLAAPDLRPDHPWFSDGGPPVVVAVGRLNQAKDYPTLLHALARVRAQRPARLLILGEGEEREALERLGQALGLAADVAMPGYVPAPQRFVRHADVYAMSSVYEGQPLALVEALALGARIVSTDCVSGPSEILDGGRWGRLVPVRDPRALGDAILQALGEERRPVPPPVLDPYRPATVAGKFLRLAGLAAG